MIKTAKKCKFCGQPLKKDWIALNKKLIRRDLKEFMCLNCMAEDFNCTVENLQDKIDEFKEQGCTLFL